MKKVLHISYTNTFGAGNVPGLMHTEMKKKGHFSKLLIHGRLAKKGKDTIIYYSRIQVFFHIFKLGINKLFSQGSENKYHFTNLNERKNYIPARKILKRINFIPDIIILYWTDRFVNSKTIFELYKMTKANIFWVMTDMGAYTGGCHYAWNCNGFESNCSNCPAISNKATALKNLEIKKNNLKDIPMTIIASSGDSVNYVRQSSLFKNSNTIEHILKVNTDQYAKYSKIEARKQLGLKNEDIVFFVGVQHHKDERKGILLLKEALEVLAQSIDSDKKSKICIAYSSITNISLFDEIPLKSVSLGFLDFKQQLPFAFKAADAYISPSVMDTGPYMINLALAHACPVISFDIGIAKALVVNNQTGFKSSDISPKSLAITMKKFLDMNTEDSQTMVSNCEKIALEKLSWNETSLVQFGF